MLRELLAHAIDQMDLRADSELGAKGAKELTEPAASETQPRDVLKRA